MILIFIVVALSVSGLRAYAETSGDLARNYDMKAVRAADLGRYYEARKLYLQELDLLLAKGKRVEAGAVYTQLGEISQIHGAFPTAETSLKKGLELLRHYAQPNDWRMVVTLDDLGWLYITWGKFMEGARLMNLARTQAEAAQPEDPRLIRHFDSQAAYLVVAGRYSEAQKDWNRALEIGKSNYGPDGREYDNILVHFGQANALNGNYDAAAQMFRRYLAIEDRLSDVPITSRAVAAAELAHVYVLQHKYPQAQCWFDDALGILKKNPEDAPLMRSMVLSYLGDHYMAQQDWSNAQLQYRQALTMQQNVLGENHAVAASMILLSKALRKLHSKDEAKQLAGCRKRLLGTDSLTVAAR